MRDSGTRSFGRLRLAAAAILACAAGLARAESFFLELPRQVVKVVVSDELRAVQDADDAMLTAYLEYPSGRPLAPPGWSSEPSRVRVVIRPLASGMRSRAEELAARALPMRSEQAPGRPWF